MVYEYTINCYCSDAYSGSKIIYHGLNIHLDKDNSRMELWFLGYISIRWKGKLGKVIHLVLDILHMQGRDIWNCQTLT